MTPPQPSIVSVSGELTSQSQGNALAACRVLVLAVSDWKALGRTIAKLTIFRSTCAVRIPRSRHDF
jgi:hypothetical protein